ncbi:MAG: hypothetical protein OXH09_18575 [Gammaproteobacteria bacterium]|nr:hypothetical protein [Gammaproteobacteria bacterium]
MGSEVIQGATFVAVLAMAGFLWRVFGNRFDTFAADVKDRFDKIDVKFEKVDEEFRGVHARLGTLEGRFAGLEGRFVGLEGRFDGLEGRFDGLEGRFGSLEARVEGLATDHQRLSEQIAEFRGEMRARFPLPPTIEP